MNPSTIAPTEGQIELAVDRMRRFLGSWSTAQLRAMAVDEGLSPALRQACAEEIESRLVSSIAFPAAGFVCWPD